MKLNTEILHIRVTADIRSKIQLLSSRYSIRKSDFIRKAISEKLDRDMKFLPKEKLLKTPF